MRERSGRARGVAAIGAPAAATLMAMALAACTGAASPGDATLSGRPGGAEPPPTTSVAPTSVAPTTVTPTTLAPASVASCPAIPARAQPDPMRPRYEVELAIHPVGGPTGGPAGAGDPTGPWVVEGRTEVRFIPDLPTDRLVFRLWPQGPRQLEAGTTMETGPVLVDGAEVASHLEDPTTLVAPLGRTLRPGEAVTAQLAWSLLPPLRNRDRISSEADGVRLGSFMPLLEWTTGVGWTTDPPTIQFHEAGAAPTADFDVTVTAPPGFDVIVSGTPVGPGRWSATAMRDVAVAVGRFTMASATAFAPNPVVVTVGVAEGIDESPEVYRDHAVALLEDFGRRYGPYPWDTLAISVTGTISTGIEYPAHLLHGVDTSGPTLSHEVGHQWFYALVGNNQSHHPWLDEGLATWAESRADGTTAAYLARSVPAAAVGRVAESIGFWDGLRTIFYTGVYVQGAQVLGALGEPDLVDCALRVYVAQNAFGLATPADLVAAAAAVFPDAAATLAAYGVRG